MRAIVLKEVPDPEPKAGYAKSFSKRALLRVVAITFSPALAAMFNAA